MDLASLEGWVAVLDHASGSTAVLWGVLLGVLCVAVMAVAQGLYRLDGVVQDALRGAGVALCHELKKIHI